MDEGMVPIKQLYPKSKYDNPVNADNWIIWGSMEPDNRLYWSCNCFNEDICVKDEGIVPFNWTALWSSGAFGLQAHGFGDAWGNKKSAPVYWRPNEVCRLPGSFTCTAWSRKKDWRETKKSWKKMILIFVPVCSSERI